MIVLDTQILGDNSGILSSKGGSVAKDSIDSIEIETPEIETGDAIDLGKSKLEKSDIEGIVEEAVASCNMTVYELELPKSERSGLLRVFLANHDGSPQGITHEHCVRVTRILNEKLDSYAEDALFPFSYTLEVSSPGVNRKLRTIEHFRHAVGERIKFTVDGSWARSNGLTLKASKNVAIIGSLEAVIESDNQSIAQSGALSEAEQTKVLKVRFESVGKSSDKKKKRVSSGELEGKYSETNSEFELPFDLIHRAQVDFEF